MPSDGGGVVPLCVGANMSSSVEEGSDSMIQKIETRSEALHGRTTLQHCSNEGFSTESPQT